MKSALIILLVVAISTSASALTIDGIKEMISHEEIPLISTPFNDPERWEGTWQLVFASKISGMFNSFGKGLINGKIGKWLKDNQKQRESTLENNIAERMKNEFLLDHTLIYEDRLHKLDHYKELEKEIKDPEDLTRLIDHLKKQKKNLEKKGRTINPVFDEYIGDLEHIRDYWEDQEGEAQIKTNAVISMAITILMAIIVLLAKVAATVVGVPM